MPYPYSIFQNTKYVVDQIFLMLIQPGLRDCPCDEGLTCTRYRTTKWGQKKHRCERLRISEEEEKEQRYSTGLNKRTNKRNTK